MGKLGNVPADIQEGIRDALGRKAKVAFARTVNLEVKPDRYESRVMALTKYRLNILTQKPPWKVETSLHFLDINLLESKTAKKMVVGTETKKLIMLSASLEEETDEFDLAVGHILTVLSQVFPGVQTEKLIMKIDFSPPRLESIRKMVPEIGQKDHGPCGNFTSVYHCMCDYHNLECQDDVVWDVDNIYLSQDSKEMNLNDFDHLDGRHLVPIISALEHNTWFTKLNASDVKLTPEAVNEVLKVMKTNASIEELVLANIGVRADFAQKLCMSLIANTGSPLTVLDLSGNALEDKGLIHLCGPITKLSRGLVELNLARTGITARGVNRLAEALLNNKNIPINLHCLDLSENSFKGEEVTSLFNFLAQPNALTDLRLGSTECALENLFSALQRGCVQNLVRLDISGNVFSYKKLGKDAAAPLSWKQFFSTAVSLKTINFSGNRLPYDALRSVLEGLGSNSSLTDFELDLSSNGLGPPGNPSAQVLETCLSTIKNISHLDISDNGFDTALISILGKLCQNTSLRKLSIGRNLNNIKPKNVPQVIEAIIQLIHQESSPIQCLNVDNLRLKMETSLLINALGINDTLTQIDLSGNQMGDLGARMLSKALMINKKLSVIYWDNNGTSPAGFQDVAAALEKNFTVRKMPTPVSDAAQAFRVNHEKTEQALQKIEAILERNHSPRKIPTDQAYRLQQGIIIGTVQQAMDRHVVKLQELISKLEHLQQNYDISSVKVDVKAEVAKTQALIKEAELIRMFLLELQKVVQEAEGEEQIQQELSSLAKRLHDIATKQFQENISAMMSYTEKLFPVTLKNEMLQKELASLSMSSKNQLSSEFIQGLVMDHLGTDLINKTSGLNLMVASNISDHILDEVLIILERNVQSLTTALSSVRSHLIVSGQLKDDDKESKEHRETIIRHKLSVSSTLDEEQDVALEIPTISDKHKSQLNRRLRPQSAVDASDVKKALELSRLKTDSQASSDLELRLDAGHEQLTSEGKKVEVEGTTDSPIPTPLPRKRRGQSTVKSEAIETLPKTTVSAMEAKEVSCPIETASKSKSDLSIVKEEVVQKVMSGPNEKSDKLKGVGQTPEVSPASQRKSDLTKGAKKDDVLQEVKATTPQKASQVGDAVGQTSMVRKSEGLGEKKEKLEEKLKQETSPAHLTKTVEDFGTDICLSGEKVPADSAALKEKDMSLDQEDARSPAAARPKVLESSTDFFPLEETSAPKLEHLGKTRPKRLKTKAATRPTPCVQVIEEENVNRGVSEFFDAIPSLPKEVKANGELTITEEHEEVTKHNISNKKDKGKPTTAGQKQETKGSIASGIMSFFKKKSPDSEGPAPVKSNTTDLPIAEGNESVPKGEDKAHGDGVKNSEELKIKETEEPMEIRPKQPAGVPKIGLPGMTGGINLTEFRAKKAAPRPSSGPVESDKLLLTDSTKDLHKRSSQAKENIESPPSTDDSISGASSSSLSSAKARPPPPLAPKPNKRASGGSQHGGNPPATQKPEAEEAQAQESEQKMEPLQVIEAAAATAAVAPDRKKRMSVREKAASIDRNSNLKSADGSSSSKKSAPPTPPTDSSTKQPETLAQQPSSDSTLSLMTSSSSSSTAVDATSESPLPSDILPKNGENDGESSSQLPTKRLSNVDVIHI